MNATEVKLKYNIESQSADALPVIVVAAGNSSRMGGNDKQLISIMGVPVIARTLQAFEKSPSISRIILVTRSQSIPEMQLICESYNISKLSDIVEGGESRQASVMRGIERLAKEDKKVLIHDGARPFVDEKIILESVLGLRDFDATVCAVKINDTVKKANADQTVKETVDRSALYAAQTPQGVCVELYKKALRENSDAVFTDDASIMEAAGYKVKLIAGNAFNIKITTPADIILAEAIVKGL